MDAAHQAAPERWHGHHQPSPLSVSAHFLICPAGNVYSSIEKDSSFTKWVAKAARNLECWVGVETIQCIPASGRPASIPGCKCDQQRDSRDARRHRVLY